MNKENILPISYLPLISDLTHQYYLGSSNNKVYLYLRINEKLLQIKEVPENDTIYNYFNL